MNSDEIIKEVAELQETIKRANARLEEIRKLCKHENTAIVNYEFQRPTIMQAEVCVHCSGLIPQPDGKKWDRQPDIYLNKLIDK